MRKLRQMEMQAGVWTMRVQLMIDRLDIVIIDRQTSVYNAPSQFVDFFFVFDLSLYLLPDIAKVLIDCFIKAIRVDFTCCWNNNIFSNKVFSMELSYIINSYGIDIISDSVRWLTNEMILNY